VKDDSGFTLAEMLVAIALLALIATYAVSALQVFSNVRRVERGVDVRASETAAMRSIQVGLAGMRPVKKIGDAGRLVFDFSGSSGVVSFVAPLDVRLERGGLYRMSYGLDAPVQRLVLHYQLYRDGGAAALENVVMLDNVTTLAFRYSADGLKWEEEWSKPEKLPSLIEVQLGTSHRVIAIPAAQ
jgi:prepilin-type N-terminal cleavage/methylation domain-containing protein